MSIQSPKLKELDELRRVEERLRRECEEVATIEAQIRALAADKTGVQANDTRIATSSKGPTKATHSIKNSRRVPPPPLQKNKVPIKHNEESTTVADVATNSKLAANVSTTVYEGNQTRSRSITSTQGSTSDAHNVKPDRRSHSGSRSRSRNRTKSSDSRSGMPEQDQSNLMEPATSLPGMAKPTRSPHLVRSPIYRPVSPSRKVGADGVRITSWGQSPRFQDKLSRFPGPGKYNPHVTDFTPTAVIPNQNEDDSILGNTWQEFEQFSGQQKARSKSIEQISTEHSAKSNDTFGNQSTKQSNVSHSTEIHDRKKSELARENALLRRQLSQQRLEHIQIQNQLKTEMDRLRRSAERHERILDSTTTRIAAARHVLNRLETASQGLNSFMAAQLTETSPGTTISRSLEHIRDRCLYFGTELQNLAKLMSTKQSPPHHDDGVGSKHDNMSNLEQTNPNNTPEESNNPIASFTRKAKRATMAINARENARAQSTMRKMALEAQFGTGASTVEWTSSNHIKSPDQSPTVRFQSHDDLEGSHSTDASPVSPAANNRNDPHHFYPPKHLSYSASPKSRTSTPSSSPRRPRHTMLAIRKPVPPKGGTLTVDDKLRYIFHVYAAHGVRRGTETIYLRNSQFFRLLRDAGIMDNRVTYPDVDVIFVRVSGTSSGGVLDYDKFVAALTRVGLRKYSLLDYESSKQYSKQSPKQNNVQQSGSTPSRHLYALYPLNTETYGHDSSKHTLNSFGQNQSPQKGSTSISATDEAQCLRRILRQHILPLFSKIEGTTLHNDRSQFADEFLQDDVLEWFNENRQAIQTIFSKYAMLDGPLGDTRTSPQIASAGWNVVRDALCHISLKQFLQFANDYKILPDLMTRQTLVNLFQETARGLGMDDTSMEELSYPGFVELLGLISFVLYQEEHDTEFNVERSPSKQMNKSHARTSQHRSRLFPNLSAKLDMLFFNLHERGSAFSEPEEAKLMKGVIQRVKLRLFSDSEETQKAQRSMSEQKLQRVQDVLMERSI